MNVEFGDGFPLVNDFRSEAFYTIAVFVREVVDDCVVSVFDVIEHVLRRVDNGHAVRKAFDIRVIIFDVPYDIFT